MNLYFIVDSLICHNEILISDSWRFVLSFLVAWCANYLDGFLMKIYFARAVFSNNYDVLNNGVADTRIDKKLINLYPVHEAFLTCLC